MLHTLGRGIEGPAAGTPDASADRESAAAMIASHANRDGRRRRAGGHASDPRPSHDAPRPVAARRADHGLGAGRDRGEGHGPADPSRAASRPRRRGAALLAPGPGDLARLARAPMGAPAAAAMGSGDLDPGRRARGRVGGDGDDVPRARAPRALPGGRDATDGGPPRLVAPPDAGVRAHRAPHLAALVRADRAGPPGPAPGLAGRTASGRHAGRPDPRVPARASRGAHRARDAGSRRPARERFAVCCASLARASVADLRPPVVPDRPPGLRVGVARALLATPLGVAAARSGVDDGALWAAANETAARLLWPLTAPWPWTPRPVVRGPRRARQEARRRAAATRM